MTQMSEYEAKQRTLMLLDQLLTDDTEAEGDHRDQRYLAMLTDIRDAVRGLAYSLLLTHEIYSEGEDSPAESYENVWRIDRARNGVTT